MLDAKKWCKVDMVMDICKVVFGDVNLAIEEDEEGEEEEDVGDISCVRS